MAKIDFIYRDLLKKIMTEGEDILDKSRGIILRQIPSYTFEYIGIPEIPIITTKKIFLKSVFAELDMFLKGVTSIKFLLDKNCNIWNKDAYSFYRKKCKESDITDVMNFEEFIATVKKGRYDSSVKLPNDYFMGSLGPIYGNQWHKHNQLIDCITNIQERNFNRRLIVNAWNAKEIPDMALPPCHWAYEFIQHKDGFVLKWHQRSVDTFLG